MTEPPADEFSIIERYFAPLAKGEEGAFGLTDDVRQTDWHGQASHPIRDRLRQDSGEIL